MARQLIDLDELFSNEVSDQDYLLIRDVSGRVDKKITAEALKTAFLSALGDLGDLAYKDKVSETDISWPAMKVAGRKLDRGTLSEAEPVVVLYGWDFGTSSGGTISKNVNFGMTFASPPTVIVQTLGYKTGSNPTSIADISGVTGEISRGGQATTTTSTTVYIAAANGGAVSSGVRILFNIIVIGVPA